MPSRISTATYARPPPGLAPWEQLLRELLQALIVAIDAGDLEAVPDFAYGWLEPWRPPNGAVAREVAKSL